MSDTRTEQYAHILARLIRCETISTWDAEPDLTKFHTFHDLLRETFPKVFAACRCEEFSGSLLLRWPGRDSTRQPVLFMNHHDVVEAAGQWAHEPFSGEIADGKLWGRGTLDTKGGLWAMLQAAEELLAEGFTPEQDIYFESACTEETTGAGADLISRTLQQRGIRFSMVLDEGGMILYDPIGGADGTFAMIGVGEKGCADLKFIARSNGGHASMPGKNTPLVRLGKFMEAVEKSSIFEVKMSDTVREMFLRMAPTMKGALKAVLGHPDLFRPAICKLVPNFSAAAGAMLRTTLAFTMAQGSDGTNVLPQEAWVVGNMRFSHHQGGKASIAAVTELAKKYDIEVEVIDPGFESPLTDFNGAPFKLVEKAVQHCFPGVYTSPYVMTGASDARYFSRVSDHCIRFLPFVISDEQLAGIHGLNECVDLSALAPAVDFYKYIMKEVSHGE